MNETVELRATYRYIKEHAWVVQGITGFLSAYFMEKPGFQVLKHFDELETGMHVWVCQVPPNMKFMNLLRRLQVDIPPCQVREGTDTPEGPPQYLLDCPDADSPPE